MSMLDSFFNKGFKASKCKTLLKLTTPRIKLLRNRREVQIKQMRRDIAKLLETGQEATARIRVEHIIREENMMAAQEILELFCELIAVRLPIIEAQKECPLDLKEAISSVCFAAPRCADLPELQQVQMLFVSKYGKEFVTAAVELRPDCGVNRKLVELLSVRAPSPETKLKLLKDIAEEHELDWDPAGTESEFFKSHEDLLDGPKQFGSGSKLPLPQEKHEEASYSEPASAPKDQPDSDSDLDSLDFPEVPNVSLRRSPGAAPTVPSAACANPENEHGSAKHAGSSEHISQDMTFESQNVFGERAASKRDVESSTFVSPSEFDSVSTKQNCSSPVVSVQCAFSEPFSAKDNYSPPLAVQRTKADDVDLKDVLAAAQAAAETAERAATAARSAASLAQIRISELTKKSNEQPPESPSENPFHSNEKLHFDHQISSGSYDSLPENRLEIGLDSPVNKTHHQMQRLSSMDDDPYSSYPNLFTSQHPKFSVGSQSFPQNSKPAGDA